MLYANYRTVVTSRGKEPRDKRGPSNVKYAFVVPLEPQERVQVNLSTRRHQDFKAYDLKCNKLSLSTWEVFASW